jgi:hypothetical protein
MKTTVPSTSDDYTSHDLWPFGSGELKTRKIDFVILINILKYLRIVHAVIRITILTRATQSVAYPLA